jgi:hypothetical protein
MQQFCSGKIFQTEHLQPMHAVPKLVEEGLDFAVLEQGRLIVHRLGEVADARGNRQLSVAVGKHATWLEPPAGSMACFVARASLFHRPGPKHGQHNGSSMFSAVMPHRR